MDIETLELQENKPTEVNAESAKVIFKALTAGEVINRSMLDAGSGTIVSNPLFTELLRCETDYTKHYHMMGYHLKNEGDYFYLYDNDVNIDDKQSSKTKIYAAIILLVRYITQEKRYLYDVLTDPHYGIAAEELAGMMGDEQYKHILLSSKLESVDGLLKVLLQRQLLLKLPSEKYLLSDAGKSIVEDIINQHSERLSAENQTEESASEVMSDDDTE